MHPAYRQLLFLLPALMIAPAFAQLFGESVSRTGPIQEDLYVAGGSVDLNVESDSDVLAAGGLVNISGTIKGDVHAAGGTVGLRMRAADDVRAAGGHVTVAGPVGGDAVLAGGNVTLTRNATVSGRALLAGGNVNVEGNVVKELRVAGGRISLAGEVRGDVLAIGEEIAVLPGAVIDGRLVYRSAREARIDPGARIAGGIVREELPRRAPTRGERVGGALMLLSSIALAAIVMYLLLPRFSHQAARTVAQAPWRCLGLGLAVVVTAPVVAVALMVTVLGAPLGLLLLAGYFITLFAGLLVSLIFVADRISAWWPPGGSSHRGWRLAGILAATLALGLLSLIPVLGALLWLILWLLGVGALVHAGAVNYRARPDMTAA